MGKQTVINYVGYMNDSYLISPLTNYAAKLVAMELIRRCVQENVFYFANNVEIDFYVPNEKLAIQVSMQVLDDMDTRERETRAFVKLHNFISDSKCLIITNSEEASLEYDGIQISILPAWKRLLRVPENI